MSISRDAQSVNGSLTKIVSSRSGLVDKSATGASMSSSICRIYFIAFPGSSDQEKTGPRQSHDPDRGGQGLAQRSDHRGLDQHRVHPAHPGLAQGKGQLAQDPDQRGSEHQGDCRDREVAGKEKVGPDPFQLGIA